MTGDAMLRLVYVRYIAASAFALGFDMALFLTAMAAGMQPILAGAIGYGAGIGAHWLLSSRAVFADRLRDRGAARRQQQALFLGSALIGLALTTGIIGLADIFAIDPRVAKLVAIAVSFQTTYVLRRKLVFA